FFGEGHADAERRVVRLVVQVFVRFVEGAIATALGYSGSLHVALPIYNAHRVAVQRARIGERSREGHAAVLVDGGVIDLHATGRDDRRHVLHGHVRRSGRVGTILVGDGDADAVGRIVWLVVEILVRGAE